MYNHKILIRFVIFLTIIYLGVCGMIYVIDYKDAKTINKIIEERKKRK